MHNRHVHDESSIIRVECIQVCPCNSLAAAHPELAAEWDFKRNGDLAPEEVPPGSQKRVRWRHRAGDGQVHRWLAAVNSRATLGKGCPECAAGQVGFIVRGLDWGVPSTLKPACSPALWIMHAIIIVRGFIDLEMPEGEDVICAYECAAVWYAPACLRCG